MPTDQELNAKVAEMARVAIAADRRCTLLTASASMSAVLATGLSCRRFVATDAGVILAVGASLAFASGVTSAWVALAEYADAMELRSRLAVVQAMAGEGVEG